MSFNPKISIVIPVYNGSNYLTEAIDSALAQTYKNIEIIVVNDGSNDNGKTEAIAKSYGSRIRYFHKDNGGVATALNCGIREAKGDYISWLSHDDLYYPNKLESQVKYLCEQDNKDIILFSNFDIRDYFNNRTYTANVIEDFDSNIYSMLCMLYASSLHGCTTLIPQKCFQSIGYFSETLRTTQDYEYWFKLLKNDYVFHYIPDSLILTRHHEEQDTHKIVDCHIREVNDLYVWSFQLFLSDFKSFSVKQLDKILSLMENRKIIDACNQIAELRDYKINLFYLKSEDPVIWLYWENKSDKKTPALIKLCQETIIRRNKKDFRIIITNPINISYYLPDLNKEYLLFEKIAHRADYIRFNLLYCYGGIWLDSDFVSFKSLKPVLKKVKQHDFVYTGYLTDNAKIFPLVCFLGAKKSSPILKTLIGNANKVLEEKAKKGVQPEWDEIGGHALQKIINQGNSFCYEFSMFSPIAVYNEDQRKIFLPVKPRRFYKRKYFGQMLPYSVCGDFFDFIGTDILKMNCYVSTVLRGNMELSKSNVIFKYLYIIKKEGLRGSFERGIYKCKVYFCRPQN